MLIGSSQSATVVDFEEALEDDGVLGLTFWFEGVNRPYLSICCDAESPECVYIESEDQKYGFETTSLTSHFIAAQIIVFELANGETFPASKINRVEIRIPKETEARLRERIEQMSLVRQRRP